MGSVYEFFLGNGAIFISSTSLRCYSSAYEMWHGITELDTFSLGVVVKAVE